MNARIADEINEQKVKDLFESAVKMSETTGKSVAEAIDYKVSVYLKYAASTNEAVAWEIRGEEAKKMI